MSVTVSIQAYPGVAVNRQILQGLVAFRRTRPDWILHLNPYWPGQDPARAPRSDAVCILPGRRVADDLPTYPSRRVYLGDGTSPEGAIRVGADNREVGRMAASHFVRAGFTSLGLFSAIARAFAVERAEGFVAEVRRLGGEAEILDVSGRGIDREAAERLGAWLRRLTKPAAVFAVNDECALEVANACAGFGLEIPHQIALLGVDNDDVVCDACPVPLSSIDHGAHRLGWEAGELIDRWVRSGHPPSPRVRRVPPTGVVTRASTEVLAIREPSLSRALTFIHGRACQGIGVEDVIRHAGTNRRTLERRFRQHLHNTIHREIQLVRIDEARRLLAHTGLPLADIAERCGFPSASEFSHVFRRYAGVSPSSYRQTHNLPDPDPARHTEAEGRRPYEASGPKA